MRWVLGVLVATLVLGVALVAFAPASFVLARIEAASEGGLAFQGVRGTAWRGSADRLILNGESFGRLDWVLAPSALLRSTLDANVSLDGPRGAGSGRVRRGRGQLLLSDVDAVLPADVLAPLLAPSGLVPHGELAVALVELRVVDRLPAALVGEAVWRRASVSGVGIGATALGDIQTRFGMQPDGRFGGELSDAGGALGVDGHFEISWLGYVVEIVLSPRSTQAAAAISEIGQPVGGDDRLLAVEGRWLAPRARSQD